MKYSEAKQFNPTMKECFFAFNKQQLEEGTAKSIPEGIKVLSGGAGLCGTQAGIDTFYEELRALKQFIIDNCDPQDVYNYEFNNHECEYTGDDSDAIRITRGYFPNAEPNMLRQNRGRQ